MHERNSFVTLTYAQESYEPGLRYKDFQLFMRRVRRRVGKCRFYACGEYGEKTLRPHFHAILFGVSFPNPFPVGKDIYGSRELEKCWPHGFSSFGGVTYESAAYVAGYCLKKVVGVSEAADRLRAKAYSRVDIRSGEVVEVSPEIGRMSLKPGIGAKWFERYWRDVYLARDGVVLRGGQVVPPPRYYDKLLLEMAAELAEAKEFDRQVRAKEFAKDCTPERLRVREIVSISKHKFLANRSL